MTMNEASTTNEASRAEVAAPAIVQRRKIILCGFFGRGNAGDEAFVHAQHRLLSKEFDIIVSIDRNAVRKDCHEWEPYRLGEVWTHDEFGRVFHEDLIHGIHIGGGSLPFGFGGQFIMTAMDARKAVVLSGIDTTLSKIAAGFEFRKHIFSQMNLIAVRNEHHFKFMKKLPNAMLGADWALGLPVEPTGDPIDVALTIRESGEATEGHFEAYRSVIRHLEGQGRRVTHVPFAPEDVDMLDRMGVPTEAREVHWHDPRTVIGRLAKANLVISIGRLHTLIMAVMAGRPAASIDPRLIRGGQFKPNHKNRMAAEVFGLTHYMSSEDFINETPDVSAIPPSAMPEDYRKRFDAMTERVMAAFTNYVVPPKRIDPKEWKEQKALAKKKELKEQKALAKRKQLRIVAKEKKGIT